MLVYYGNKFKINTLKCNSKQIYKQLMDFRLRQMREDKHHLIDHPGSTPTARIQAGHF